MINNGARCIFPAAVGEKYTKIQHDAISLRNRSAFYSSAFPQNSSIP
ncbi:hypothetical protein CUS_8099 [Ruminococcus albus 8]|uniref:Uncharacterized protein n=1 Tax=Ruminococcus albus 8 TaxID=246199 RepID=E9SAY6_RUMAL|nr:hypothetical protein CUS_8099 [Ruminococcus albus 8]